MTSTRSTALLCCVVLLCAPSALRAADTMEPFEAGASDLDFYVGADGFGRGPEQGSLSSEIMLGYGVLPQLSAFLGATVAGNQQLADGSAGVFMGLYGTPLDTDHLDLDLIFDVGAGGPGFSEITLSPGFELNLDLAPDLESAGLYLRGGLPISGRDAPISMRRLGHRHQTLAWLEATLGAYYQVAMGHQLLVEYLVGAHLPSAEEIGGVDAHGLALGYNVEIIPGFELINQLLVELPIGAVETGFAVSTGFIATLPAGG